MNDTRVKITCKRYAEAFFQVIEEDDFEECFKDFEAISAIYFGTMVCVKSSISTHSLISQNRNAAANLRHHGPA
jgi:hypothetical protein